MCGMCPDVYGGCDQVACGARPKVDANGKPRSRYMQWFRFGDVACEHVRARHKPTCPVPDGGYNEDCNGDCLDDEDEPSKASST